MVSPTSFILFPFYLWPGPDNTATNWQRLYDSIAAYPQTEFRVVINPNDGPEAGCPETPWITAMSKLNSYPNVKTLGYVHTANAWDCGDSGTDICVCSRSVAEMQEDINRYQKWNTGACTNSDIHLNGIFYDEAPATAGPHSDYMRQLVTYANDTLTKGSLSLFNSGQAVDEVYWEIADYINVYEKPSPSLSELPTIHTLIKKQSRAEQTTLIINNYHDDLQTMSKYVQATLSDAQDGAAGLFITDSDSYGGFPSFWDELVDLVNGTTVPDNTKTSQKVVESAQTVQAGLC